MDKLVNFLNKYSLVLVAVGVILLIIGISSIGSLPDPRMLYPGEATARYYTPLRIYRIVEIIGIITTLLGIYFYVTNKNKIK